ncbi:hypothetical protein EV361DRAFT_633030 [Lentinula raphanica]|uniref:NAD(P)-binding protein n=1 Tax=Lentinula raphanica TaxID=153919 RepID=A0AA38UDM6_9AGAR|nr:hypothetical protein F5878DRAFT_664897 [Lentinula raphanica]KAJ3965711.1 hypothetical protein EV361DRAFT_633030 [Lentinula raphanica]
MNETSPQQLVWMITGCSTGFGRRFIPAILRKGDKVIATARKLSTIENLAGEVSEQGLDASNLKILELDLEWNTAKLEGVVDEALKVWGRVDVLVANGGIGMKSLIEEADAQKFTRQFQINMFGHIDVINAVLPSMRARRSGTIVVFGSRSSWRPELPATGLYASSKAALTAYAETLATEIAFFSIRVLIVQPSSFRTENMLTYPYHDDKRIPEYNILREKALAGAGSLHGNQPGDPVKAVELVVDVVRGEGKAKGKKFPRYLPLGSNAGQAIKEKTDMMKSVLEEWGDIIGSEVDYQTTGGTKMEYS